MRLTKGRQATLPEDLEAPSLATMVTGETAWTLPWAMWADEQRRLWLHPNYPAETTPGGTVEMRVELRRDGYHVWPTRSCTYQPESRPFVGSDRVQNWLPVVELHR